MHAAAGNEGTGGPAWLARPSRSSAPGPGHPAAGWLHSVGRVSVSVVSSSIEGILLSLLCCPQHWLEVVPLGS